MCTDSRNGESTATVSRIETSLRRLPSSRTQDVRAIRRVISKELRDAPPHFVIHVALELVARGGWQERFVAYELILKHPGALAAVNARNAVALASTLGDWAAVDTFACYVAGPAWREQQISDSVIRQWAASHDRWWRRAAVVCTVALNNKARGGHGDARRTIDICRRVVADRDDMVVKALSWALRELAKRDPATARAFVHAHAAQLAPRVRREVASKLDTGRKQPRHRGQAARDQHGERVRLSSVHLPSTTEALVPAISESADR